MPSSSSSSRQSAASGVSPLWIFPPGNSQSPAIALPLGRCCSNTRPRSSISAALTIGTIGSGSAPVAAIDIDIAMCQIAGPDFGAALADAEIDLDEDIAARHMLRDRRFVI